MGLEKLKPNHLSNFIVIIASFLYGIIGGPYRKLAEGPVVR